MSDTDSYSNGSCDDSAFLEIKTTTNADSNRKENENSKIPLAGVLAKTSPAIFTCLSEITDLSWGNVK